MSLGPTKIIDERYTPERTNGVMEVCRTCKEVKVITDFPKCSTKKNGYNSRCLVCNRMENKKRYDRCDKSKRREALRKWQDANRDYVNAYAHKRKNPNEEFIPKGHGVKFTSYQEANESKNQYYHDNKEYRLAYMSKRNQRPDIKAQRAAYESKRLRENLHHRIKSHLAKRINSALKETKRIARTMEVTGCDIPFLKRWLERQFWNGMTWENYGYRGWHIDHITPCASFDLTDPEQQKVCFHWSNLQPLWAKDNVSKKDTILPAIDYQI